MMAPSYDRGGHTDRVQVGTCQYLADMLSRVKEEAQRGASRIVVEWEGER